MFIWTISDIIGAIFTVLLLLFFGGLFLLIKLDDWLRKRRAARKLRS